MPWKGVTVTEHGERFLEDYQLNYYSIIELTGVSASLASWFQLLEMLRGECDVKDLISNKEQRID